MIHEAGDVFKHSGSAGQVLQLSDNVENSTYPKDQQEGGENVRKHAQVHSWKTAAQVVCVR